MIDENENVNDLNTTQEINPQPIAAELQTIIPSVPTPTILERLKTKKLFLISALLVLVVLTISVIGLYYFSSQKTIIQSKLSNNTGLTLPTSLPKSSPSATKEEAFVQYIKSEKILETVKIPDEENITTATFDFYKIGNITSGKYQSSDLVLAAITFEGPCKSASCGKPIRFRYALKDKIVTFLPKISAPYKPYHPRDPLGQNINPFKKFGLSLSIDDNFTIPVLEYPKEITSNSPRQILKAPEYHMEEDGELDSSTLYKVFTQPIFGDIYTTKAEFSPSRSFEPEGSGGFGAGSGTDGCRDTGCFTTNQFFTFRPDGTFLKFGYNPDVSVKDITWNDNKKTGDEYASYTVVGCSIEPLDDNSVVSPSLVNDTDLVAVGKANNTGDIIYGLKDQNHKLYTEFYSTYKEYYAGPYIYPEEKRQTKSFNEFINSRPIFLWHDPFGRLIRFNNNEFLPPAACEPIIYLYPQTTQKVSVTFDKIVNLFDSTPEYQNGWNVIADPAGMILNPLDNRIYPYLFWEGWSLIFPIQSKGFVVKQGEVESFLIKTLPKLGLNEKEEKDFIKAWLPYFSDSPYYFITFLDPEVIDKIAPLRISPKPDTVIRVLMDIKPLEKPIKVSKPKFAEVPQRSGFTVVEWGGLKR